jgi:hypothetical protein
MVGNPKNSDDQQVSIYLYIRYSRYCCSVSRLYGAIEGKTILQFHYRTLEGKQREVKSLGLRQNQKNHLTKRGFEFSAFSNRIHAGLAPVMHTFDRGL